MAYSFDRTMSALGQLPGQEDPDSSQNTSNVLAPTPQSGNRQNLAGSVPTDTITATTTAGDLTGGPGASMPGAAPKSPDSPNVSNTTANNSLINKNAGRVSSPVDVQGLQTNIAGAKSGLQNEANSYVSGAGDLFGGGKVSDAYGGQINQFLSNGVSPGQASSEPIPTGGPPSNFDAYQAQAGGQYGGQAQPYDFTDLYKMGATQVDPLKIQTNTNFQQANDLGTDAGLRNLFRQGNDAEYNQGQAALDTALLTRTPGFNQQRDQVTQANQALGDYKNQVTASAQGFAQDTRDQAQKAWKNNVNDMLTSGETQMQNSAQAQADAFKQQLLSGAPFGYAENQANRVVKDNGLSSSVANGLRPTSYVKSSVDPNSVRWDQFLSGDQANAYNSVNALMGKGGTPLASGAQQYYGKTAADAGFSFDDAKYKADVQDAATQRMKDTQAAAAAKLAAQSKAEQNSPFAQGTYTDNSGLPTGDPGTAPYNGPLMKDPFDTERLRQGAVDFAGNALKKSRFL